jgi:MOSC domain-containing protein YiiM
MSDKPTLQVLLKTLTQTGKVEWIGVREKKRAPLLELQNVNAIAGKGLQGDRYAGRSGKRSVTLIQAEHIQAIAALLHTDEVHPQQLRRNIVISGINLLALKGKQFELGAAVLEMTGLCHPCSRMEENFGAGGYNAVRGHGGINARIVASGEIKIGDALRVLGA